MAQVIERIIRHHSLSLISAYQLYHSPYKGLWSDSHKLFLLAVKKNCTEKNDTLSLDEDSEFDSIWDDL